MTTVESNVVPIMYMGGTGGNFLSLFLNRAHRNIQENLVLSKNGNAHINEYGIELEYTKLLTPDIDKISSITRIKKYHESFIWYPSVHATDTDLMISNFQRVIKITYELNDIEELAKIFIIKFVVDHQKIISNDEVIRQYERYLLVLNKYIEFFNNSSNIYGENLLCVPWKNIYKNDYQTLIEKLSNFTKIPKDNFNIENLLTWREKTKIGVVQMTKYIEGEDYGIQ